MFRLNSRGFVLAELDAQSNGEIGFDRSDAMETASFSIIVPTYNRPAELGECLGSLARLDYPAALVEVIVVDDGGVAASDGIVAPFRERLNLTLLRQDNSGATTARNAGAAAAKGDYLVFTDDDCEFTPDWLKTLAARLAVSPEAMVGGAVLNNLPGNIASTASHLLLQFVLDYYNQGGGRTGFLSGNHQAVPAAGFRAIGGFDERFPPGIGADDREFCDRWIHVGQPLIYAPEVKIYHSYVRTLRGFMRQHFKNGRGAWYFQRILAKRNRRVNVEPLCGFYGNLLLYPLRERTGWRAPVFVFLLIAAQAANVAGFFWQRRLASKGVLGREGI